MTTRNREYIPGVCNIGQAEIKMRRAMSWIALIVGFALWATLIAVRADAAWRLLVFFPAMISAIGFLQAAWHFCAKFGLGGVFNFGPNVGKTDTVEQAEYRRKDRQTALKIIGLSMLIGLIIAATAFYIPL